MLMMHAPRGTGDYQISDWSPEDFKAHIAFMHDLNTELTAAGEFVGGRGARAAGRGEARARRRRTARRVTDGPFPETKEFLAGYWIVDVDSAERAYADRRRGVGGAGPGRHAAEHGDRGAPGDERAARRRVSDDRSSTPTIEHLLRELAPQVLGAVARRHGDFAAAEDAVQEALIAAAAQWPAEGVPDNPRGWLYHVALRRLTDHAAQRDRAPAPRGRRRQRDVAPTERSSRRRTRSSASDEDDTLVLLFMCCHPALTPPSAIALTLRAVGGLTTAEIASAFLVPEATMAQRISRAKQSIKTSGVPFAMPTDARARASGCARCCTCSI